MNIDIDNDRRRDRAVGLSERGLWLPESPNRVPGTFKAFKEMAHMLLHEELARSRIRDLQQAVPHRQEVLRIRAARRWSWVASWAASRARRYSR